MTAILSYRIEHDRHTLLLKSATKQLKMSNSLLHFLLKTAILNFYLQSLPFARITCRFVPPVLPQVLLAKLQFCPVKKMCYAPGKEI